MYYLCLKASFSIGNIAHSLIKYSLIKVISLKSVYFHIKTITLSYIVWLSLI